MSKKIFLHIIILLISKSILSQDTIDYKFFNEESGIFNEEIYNITSDNKGIIYFNSSTGAEYFDGSKFYKFKDIEKNIFNKFPRLSYSNNHLIFNTLNEVYFFDGKDYSLFFNQKDKSPISFLSFSKNGKFAIYSLNTKIYIRSVIHPCIFFELYDSKNPDNEYKYFNLKNNGDVLASTTNGLINISKNKITKLTESVSYKSFIDEKNNLIYNITGNSIDIFDFKNTLLKTIDFRKNLFENLDISINNLKVYSYFINDHLYIYSPLLNHNKIESYDYESLNFINNSKNIFDISISENYTIKQIALPNELTSPTFFYTNNNKELWVSSLKGLYKINIDNNIPNLKFTKTISSINNIVSNGDKIVVSDNFLNLKNIDSLGILSENIIPDKIRKTLNIDFTESSYCLTFGNRKNIFIGTINEGIIEIDSNKQINYLTKELDGFEKICMAVTKDDIGNIYAGGYNKLFKIDLDKKITYLEHPQLKRKFIYTLKKIDDKIFIFSDNTILLYAHDSLSDFSTQLKVYNTNFSNIEKFKDKYILTSFNNGVYALGKNKNGGWQIENHFNKKNGLVSNEYFNVKTDNENKIWLLSSHSIDIIRFVNNEYKIVSLKNNIKLKNEFYLEGSMHIDQNGILYFGGKNGVSIFDTKNIILDSNNNSSVNISSIYINEEKYFPTKKIDQVSLTELVINPIFNYKENNIKFEFGAINFSDNKINYQYYLEGLEEEWKSTTKENIINYRNLSPNEYVFHIRFSVNGNWSKTTDYAFTILAPWWKTKLAYLLYVLSLFASIYFLIRYKINDLKNKQNKKLKEIEEKNKFLNIQSAALLNQLKPHFIFNALAPLQHYIYTSNKEKGIKYLQSFSNVLRSLLNHSREEFVSLNNEIDFLNYYLIQQQIERNNTFNFNIINEIKSNYFLPTLMIQPIIENIIEHGFKENEIGEIVITFNQTNSNYINIKISENGNGFDLNNQIKNSKNRALNIISDKIEIYKQQPTYKNASIVSSYEINLFIITLILPYKDEN